MMKYTTLAIAMGTVALAGCKDSTGTLPLDAPVIESITSKPLVRSQDVRTPAHAVEVAGRAKPREVVVRPPVGEQLGAQP